MKRQCVCVVFVIISLSSMQIQAQNSKKIKSTELDSTFITRFTEGVAKEKYIKNSDLKVELIDFCNISPKQCGIFAFASVSIVKVLEGKYLNDTIIVAQLCEEMKYTRKKTYQLKYTPPPNFSVLMCTNLYKYEYDASYNADYNLKEENKHYLVFGNLDEYITSIRSK